jgi:hypothetical protein
LHLFIEFKLEEADKIDKLYIDYPQKLNKKEIYDLGKTISSDSKLLNSLFNAYYYKNSTGTSSYHSILDQEKNEIFSLYVLKENNIKIENSKTGCRIEICIKSPIKKTTYLRIRIDHDYHSFLSHTDKPSNSLFQSAFSETEIIDFRVNEARELSMELLEHVKSEGDMFTFSKIHFFFMCGSREEYIFSHVPFNSCRQLEKNRWKDYIGPIYDKNTEAILAFHWKTSSTKKNIKEYNALIQTRYENNNWGTILWYLVVLLCLSISFNLISNFIYAQIMS